MFNKAKKLVLAAITLITLNSAIAIEHHRTNQTIAEKIVINNPWVRSAPPNTPMLGAFMEIHNNSNQTVKLLSADSKGYRRLELHKTQYEDGMMKMIKQDFMPIPAHGKLTLKPGSWHIMLIAPESVPREGGTVMIDLVFDNGLSKTVHAPVRKMKKIMGNRHYMTH
ncbi:Copper metallochaperone, bacterial analog of Cox17 protein [Bathymodiolus heckerae thiotrophic gill symbiont]|uniref:copper chaperone PCu(A)C n=1 Tax=Bathymodiolus heckerae thiotrophic gill symbiont TaxID=1052212 RepID=UPI0010BBE986|nr:copper chaperone PCu(A)C [Bathymodiolus heckerae thiotrophic gill symbiont]SMN12743.1 Copper metallochaperone, bacterial analog of Cox17 protein [Bathymodiolus heckerae thiotrophic gill symbiont]SMN14488.1 Copper metallochaperone, bacterial analog of Cox17 protein [uncultured Candidatus Thioglobus sp.]